MKIPFPGGIELPIQIEFAGKTPDEAIPIAEDVLPAPPGIFLRRLVFQGGEGMGKHYRVRLQNPFSVSLFVWLTVDGLPVTSDGKAMFFWLQPGETRTVSGHRFPSCCSLPFIFGDTKEKAGNTPKPGTIELRFRIVAFDDPSPDFTVRFRYGS